MDSGDFDARSHVLQTTLNEISTTNSTDADSAESCCVICLDRITEPARAQPCHHDNFDFLCLVSWLEEQAKCPLCKASVSTVEYSFENNGPPKIYQIPGKEAGELPAVVYRRPQPRPRLQHRQARSQPYTPPQNEDEALSHRRHIYREQLYSLHVGSNRVSRFRELTPQIFNSDAELVARARRWIRRELKVFEFLYSEDLNRSGGSTPLRRANNAEFLLEYIIAILKTVDLQGSSGQAEEMLQEFLGRDNTRLFLHELRAWLRSPYTSLSDWDRAVQYSEPREKGMDFQRSTEAGSPRNGRGCESGRSQRSNQPSRRDGNHERTHRYRGRGQRFTPYSNTHSRYQRESQGYVPD